MSGCSRKESLRTRRKGSLRRRDDTSVTALEKYSLEDTLGTGAYAKVKLAKCRDTTEKEEREFRDNEIGTDV